MKGLPEDLNNYFEQRVQREIEAIEAKIAELSQEREALKRQLMKSKTHRPEWNDVARRNSVNRIMVETRLIDELEVATQPVHTSRLYALAKLGNSELTENTFRTHLHRMKQKGIIMSARRGYWALPKKGG